MIRRIGVLLVFLVPMLASKAQTLLWDVDFKTVFDNREGDNKFSDAKTFFLTQLSPAVGVAVMDGMHSVMGGVTWTQPIGCEWDGARVSPLLYYRYKKNGVEGYLGMFPRSALYRKVPDYIWNDSSYYVQYSIRGAGIVNIGKNGFFQAVLDWRGMQTETRREAFNIIAMGEWHPATTQLFIAGGTAMMNHLARRKNAPVEEKVVDNFLINPYIGCDITESLPQLTSLDLKVGPLMTVTRDRAGENKWNLEAGLWLEGNFRWRWLVLREELYCGGRLFPYYSTYGNVLNQGESYYGSGFYSRTEVQGYLIDKSFVKLKASLDFHVDRSSLMFYQRLILNIYFNGSYPGKKSISNAKAN